jgi:serine phosphatase RsbU (regulator of sigma subunit)
MHARSNSLDLTLEQIAKPSLPLALAVLATTWFGMLLYDLIATNYSITSPADYGLFRSLVPLVALLPTFVRLLKPDRISNDQEAFETFRKLTITLSVITGAIFLPSLLPINYSEQAIPDNLGSFLVGRFIGLIALLGVPVLAEELLRIYRYRSRGPVPKLATYYTYGLIIVITLSQILPLPRTGRVDLPEVANVIGGLLGVIAIFLPGPLGWIVYLRKQQKLQLLGLSCAGLVAGGIMMAIGESMETGKAFFSLFPGLPAFLFVVTVPILITQLAVFFKSLISLPTAGAIDRRNMEVSSLSNFARLLTQSFDIEDLIDTAIAIACDVTGGTAAWVEIVREDGREILYGSTPRLPARIASQLMDTQISSGLTLSRAAQERQHIEVVHRVSGAAWQTNSSETRQLQSIAAAPLQLGSKLFGTIYVAKEKSDDFDREDVSILGAVADQIALAIEQSRLIRTSIERERFEQEMLIARDLQQRLLPKLMPESPYYELYAESQPASIVGGDYYDIVTFNDQSIGIVIADVSGTGASAALYMGMVKGIIQALSGKCATPQELLIKANTALYGNIDNRWFVTMTCAQIIEPERILRIARAGHCPTLLMQQGKGLYSTPKGLGLAIAKPHLFDRNLELEERCFKAGDFTIFFSDGLPEARSRQGEELGYDRLLSIAECGAVKSATSRDLRDTMFEGISTFTQGEAPADDSTLVIVRWR